MTSPRENPKPTSHYYFLIETRRLAESVNTLNSSLATATGDSWQKKWPARALKGRQESSHQQDIWQYPHPPFAETLCIPQETPRGGSTQYPYSLKKILLVAFCAFTWLISRFHMAERLFQPKKSLKPTLSEHGSVSRNVEDGAGKLFKPLAMIICPREITIHSEPFSYFGYMKIAPRRRSYLRQKNLQRELSRHFLQSVVRFNHCWFCINKHQRWKFCEAGWKITSHQLKNEATLNSRFNDFYQTLQLACTTTAKSYELWSNRKIVVKCSGSQTCLSCNPNQGSDYVLLPCFFNSARIPGRTFLLHWSLIVQNNIVVLVLVYLSEESHITPGGWFTPTLETTDPVKLW